MIVGLPKALLYYKYQYLWQAFFTALGVEVVVSDDTDQKIMADGIRFSIDECCLPAKIYMGHVYSLIGKCDYILVPRVESLGRRELVCVKFNALYDIVKNTFPDVQLLDYNLDAANGESEIKGFVRLGQQLGKSYSQSLRAYRIARKAQAAEERRLAADQAELLKSGDALKILIVSHPYNVYDKMLGWPIVRQIKSLGGVPIFADALDRRACREKSPEISRQLYWTYNKELVGAIGLLQDQVDGVVLLTAFPCGPDSLVNELVLRRIKKTPVINMILDELQGEAGLCTRIESFIDIIKQRKKEERKKEGRQACG